MRMETVQTTFENSYGARKFTLEMRIGAADPQGRPCITIMLPGED